MLLFPSINNKNTSKTYITNIICTNNKNNDSDDTNEVNDPEVEELKNSTEETKSEIDELLNDI